MWNMKNTLWKIKPIKIGRHSGTTYCFWCKDCTENFRPEKVKMINKVPRKISLCCLSIYLLDWQTTRFLKQKIN